MFGQGSTVSFTFSRVLVKVVPIRCLRTPCTGCTRGPHQGICPGSLHCQIRSRGSGSAGYTNRHGRRRWSSPARLSAPLVRRYLSTSSCGSLVFFPTSPAIPRRRIPDKRGYARTGRHSTVCRQRCERRIRCQCTRPCRGRTFFQASPQSNKKAAVTPAKKSAAKARVRAINAVLVAGVNVSQCPTWWGFCQPSTSP